MSKFKSFAQQGSFRDYQLQAPDETGKIKEETARTIRGKERAQASLERQNNLYLQAQKLAQGVEENQREQNFRLETENRKAFLDALRRDNEIQTQNDKVAAAQSAETFKQLSAFSKSAFELYGQYQEVDLKRNQQENARLAYAAGADYKTVIGIQALGDNLTRSEFAQTEFMRQKLAEGGNVDALFALYERRASRAFINNIAVAQNTAHGYGIAAQQEMLRFKKENPEATIEEQKLNLKAFESEYFVNITGADGRGLNANLMTTYVAPTMRRIQTGFESQLEKQQREEQQSIVKQNFMKQLDHAWNTGKAAGVYKYLTEKGIANAENFEMYAEWVTNKSLDFGPTGLDSKDMEALKGFQYKGVDYKQTGKLTTYGESRGSLSDGAKFNQSYNTRIRAEKQLDQAARADRIRQADAASIEFHNEKIEDNRVTAVEVAESVAMDAATGIPGYESPGTIQLKKQQDSVRFESFFRADFTKKVNNGTLTFEDLNQAGVSYKLRQEFLPALEKQNLITGTQEYKDGVTAIKTAITEHRLVKAGRGASNRDHWTTEQYLNLQLQEFKKQAISLNDVSQISKLASGRVDVITANQEKTGFINENGHYSSAIAETEEQAKDYRAMQFEDGKFIEGRLKSNFSDPAVAVNVYGQNNFYEDYYPMQRGQITSRLRRRAAQMGMSPLAAINFLASGVGQPAVAEDAAVQALMEKVAPLQRLLNVYRTEARYDRAMYKMNGGNAPTRFDQPMPPGVQGLAALVSSGEGSPTSMFPGENYPEMLDMSISEVVEFQKEKLKDGRASAAAGSYQILYPEVAAQRVGISLDEKFTPENQLKMFIGTLLNKPGRENLAAYLQGKSDDIELAMDELSQEYASIEYRNGRSYYDDGVNKASISREKLRSAMISAREELTNQ